MSEEPTAEAVALVPVAPAVLAPIAKPASLSPAVYLARLNPYRVLNLADRTIYQFLRVGCTKMDESALSRTLTKDRSIERHIALITVRPGGKTFKLSYYPHGEAAQIVTDLPVEALGQAVEDLRGAGF